ncbi:MAG: ribosome-binding factor A [Acidobacteriota bacterium]
MSQRLNKVNSLIQQSFGEVLQRQADLPPDVLVTISRVDTTKNLQRTTIWLYVTPFERADGVLADLEGQLYDLQGFLNRALHLRPLPRIKLRIDKGAEHADHIESLLKHISQ